MRRETAGVMQLNLPPECYHLHCQTIEAARSTSTLYALMTVLIVIVMGLGEGYMVGIYELTSTGDHLFD